MRSIKDNQAPLIHQNMYKHHVWPIDSLIQNGWPRSVFSSCCQAFPFIHPNEYTWQTADYHTTTVIYSIHSGIFNWGQCSMFFLFFSAWDTVMTMKMASLNKKHNWPMHSFQTFTIFLWSSIGFIVNQNYPYSW